MKNATGISRWTSAGRNHAVHILNDEGSLVLCKKQFFSHNTSALDIEKVTCPRCLAIFKKLNIADVVGRSEQCDHDYGNGTATGWYVCRKCGDMY